MHLDFDNIEYLKFGTERQRQAYTVLNDNEILSKLKSFAPLLVGTVPINIDIETSDLDIICHWTDKAEFISTLNTLFCDQVDFRIIENGSDNSVLAGFRLQDFEIEIFGQNIPTKEQSAYRHMVIENDLLERNGSDFRSQIVGLKRQGHKTEPAFAIALGLTGNPYVELLKLETGPLLSPAGAKAPGGR